MTSASVTVKLSPTDFNLMVETLEEARATQNEEAKDHSGQVAHEARQRAVQLDNLLRQLK
jgi:hypothetical protein